MKVLKQNAIAASLYYVLGKAALFFMVEPVYASAIWPASGVALVLVLRYGYRVLPGIFLAAYFIYLPPHFTYVPVIYSSSLFSFCFAVGVLAQIFLASCFVQKHLRSLDLIVLTDIVKFFFLAGFLAGLIGTMVQVSLLVLFSQIDESVFLNYLLVWWAGSFVGIVLFAPLTLMFVSDKTSVWRLHRRSLIVPFLIIFVVMNAMFLFGKDLESKRLESEFKNAIYNFNEAVDYQFRELFIALHSVQAFYLSSDFVSRDEFKTFLGNLNKQFPEIKSVAWVPKVEKDELESFIKRAQEDGISDYYVKEVNPDGSLSRIENRDVYYPIFYIEPLEDNIKALGIDNSSEANRLKATLKARDENKVMATAPLVLTQDQKTNDKSVLLITPIYKKGLPFSTPKERQENLLGYITVATALKDVIAGSFQLSSVLEDINFHILDISGTHPVNVFSNTQEPLNPLINVEEHIDYEFGGRKWRMSFQPAVSFFTQKRDHSLFIEILGGMMGNVLFVTFLLYMTGQSQETARLIDERTNELSLEKENMERINESLEAKQSDLQEALSKQSDARRAILNVFEDLEVEKKNLESLKNELERSNRDLEQFAYVASHDLQEPLRMVTSFTQLLKRKYDNQLDDKAREYINFAVDGSKRMQGLIDDLLTFSRVGRSNSEIEDVDLNEVLKEILQDLSLLIDETNARIEFGTLPVMRSNRSQMRHLFQNFITNAIKFRKEDPVIKISFRENSEEYQFSVSDNGIGIEEKHIEKIFIIFQRLHERNKYAGTGIGLAVCKKIIENFGGRIWVLSKVGEGTTFNFSLKKGAA